ncbi:Chitinase 4 [Sporothrix curviconia]|uniref:chitinase n=1 Tax=Sporothrix curviconia TaxID=1260050 RepID=A0ABP0BQB7_9PEZI
MKPFSIAAISWLFATQVAAAPPHLNARARGIGLAPNATATRVQSACAAKSPTTSATLSIGTPGASAPNSPPAPDAPGTAVNGLVSALYYSNTYVKQALKIEPDQLPVSNITRILYAFGKIAADGTVSAGDAQTDLEAKTGANLPEEAGKTNAYGRVRKINLIKRANRHVKVLLSIGGWGADQYLSAAASTEAGRNRFASTAVELVTDWGFDGVDVDWEYVQTKADRANVVLLLKATRAAFDAYAVQNAPEYHFLITYASPAGAQNYKALDIAGMDPYIDTWNLMTYDYCGSWSDIATFQSNLYESAEFHTETSSDEIISYYLSQGISPAKVHMGLPLYGHVFENTDGMGTKFNGTGPGENGQPGTWWYKDLPKPGVYGTSDNKAGAAWSYDEKARELITYDDPGSAQLKAEYIKSKGLGGAFFWEANQDRTDSKSLVHLVAKKFTQPKLDSSMNLISYPTSKYDNIRLGA